MIIDIRHYLYLVMTIRIHVSTIHESPVKMPKWVFVALNGGTTF